MNHELPQSHSEIVWPHPSMVEVGPGVDFVYIMRKDGDFAMEPVAEAFCAEYGLPGDKVKETLLEEYDTFFAKLADNLLLAFGPKGNFELHIFDPDVLDYRERQKAGDLPIVSLDPLMHKGVLELRVSRGFWPSGTKDHGQVSRPGSLSLETQAKQIKKLIGETPVCIVEDDIFSGGSVISALDLLLQAGVKIHKLITGIQVGQPTKLDKMGIVVDSVVKYETSDGTNIFDKVDLGDPRDYLAGASGLVIKTPGGSYGRAPYLLPFVSTSARASIPKEKEREFAARTLLANWQFFWSVESQIGKPVLLKHMDVHFGTFLHTVFGIDFYTPMTQVVAWFLDNLDKLWEVNEKLGKLHEQLDMLGLPANLVFLDINGTLIPEDSPDGKLNPSLLQSFQEKVAVLAASGIAVGLNSDSPLPQLEAFAERIGLGDCPIVAENGTILAYRGKAMVLNSLKEKQALIEAITDLATCLGYVRTEDCVAPEFGGTPPDNNGKTWAFGANRQTLLSVFGPPQLIKKLGERCVGDDSISVDCSPEYGYFAAHPGYYKENKGKALSLLVQFGHKVVMVGNSMSDWIDPASGVACSFVGGSRISPDIAVQSAYVSGLPTIQGVNDILNKIVL